MHVANRFAHPFVILVLCVLAMRLWFAIPDLLIIFVVFQCWAFYFVTGADPKSAVPVALCFILGEIFAVGIIASADALNATMGNWALTMTVGIGAGLMVLLAETVKAVGIVPAYFMGAGTYFAYYFGYTDQSDHVMPTVLIAFSLIVGFVCGWLTVMLYAAWDKRHTRSDQ